MIVRCQLAAFSVMLMSAVGWGQQAYLAPATDGPGPLLNVSVSDIYVGAETQIESSSDRVVGEAAAMVSMEAPPSACCSCGQKRCHGVCTDPGRPRKPWIDKPGDRDRGDCPPYRYCMPDCKRAGNPHCVAWWAQCSVSEKYSSWFVGGGSPFRRGRCRKPTEGTWGLDYGGLFGHAKVWLNYTRHHREQGGEGAYETDGEPEFVSKAHHLLHLGH